MILPQLFCGEPADGSLVLRLSGQPHTQLHLSYKLSYARPLKEGASGRPMSAYYSRNTKKPKPKGQFESDEDNDMGIKLENSQSSKKTPVEGSSVPKTATGQPLVRAWEEEAPQRPSEDPTTPTETPTKAHKTKGHRHHRSSLDSEPRTPADESKTKLPAAAPAVVGGVSSLLVERLEERIASAVGTAVEQVLKKLTTLEVRMTRTEENAFAAAQHSG